MFTECVESKQPDGEPGRRQPQQRHRARAGRRHDTGSDVTGEHRRAAREGPDPPGLPQHPPHHHRPHAAPFQYAHFINSHIGVSFKVRLYTARTRPRPTRPRTRTRPFSHFAIQIENEIERGKPSTDY